jgi:hypothetical protein
VLSAFRRNRKRRPIPVPADEVGSPERLDELVVIARPRMWISLGVLAVLVVVLVGWSFTGEIPVSQSGEGLIAYPSGPATARAPVTGRLAPPVSRLGATVRSGQVIARVVNGARVVPVRSQVTGRIANVTPLPDDTVRAGQPLFEINPRDEVLRMFAYLPLGQAKSIFPGLPVQVSPSNTPKSSFGFLEGRVVSVAGYPASPQDIAARAGGQGAGQLARTLLGDGPKLEVEIGLTRDARTVSGYRWSSSVGRLVPVTSGTLASASIVFEHQHPIDLIIPGPKQLR